MIASKSAEELSPLLRPLTPTGSNPVFPPLLARVPALQSGRHTRRRIILRKHTVLALPWASGAARTSRLLLAKCTRSRRHRIMLCRSTREDGRERCITGVLRLHALSREACFEKSCDLGSPYLCDALAMDVFFVICDCHRDDSAALSAKPREQ